MDAVALEEVNDITTATGADDDQLADLIKTLTRQEAEALWQTVMQLKPALADL
jgi:hypothetical protein